MRLRWGPYATRLAEQVMVIDPFYVIGILSSQAEGGLAAIFRDLICAFDARAFCLPCATCLGPGDGACAYPGSTELFGFCERCTRRLGNPQSAPASRIVSYEDALRHVATSFRRGHRVQMRRIIKRLLLAKGGPAQATEAAMLAYLSACAPRSCGTHRSSASTA